MTTDPATLAQHDDLARTDPELVAVVDRFAFGDVPAAVDLDPVTAFLTRLAATIAVGAVREFRVLLGAALTAGVTPVQAQEVVYQAVPYAGLARVLDFVHATGDVLAERGVALPLPARSTVTPETRAARGLAVQQEIVGEDAVAAMHAGAPADEAHVQRFLTAHCFGDHHTRDGLDLPARELVTLALLVALGGADPQVRGHVAGNLRVGNDRATMIAVLTHLLPYVGYPRTLNALRALDEVAPPA